MSSVDLPIPGWFVCGGFDCGSAEVGFLLLAGGASVDAGGGGGVFRFCCAAGGCDGDVVCGEWDGGLSEKVDGKWKVAPDFQVEAVQCDDFAVRFPRDSPVPVLLHGTTLRRAESIFRYGRDLRYREPCGVDEASEFSMNRESGPFPLMHPREYAIGKAEKFPNEGGPALLAVDVPEELIELTIDEWFPAENGVVVFDDRHGIRQLLEKWDELSKEIHVIRDWAHE